MYTYVIIDDEFLTRRGTIEKLAPLSEKLQCVGEGEDGEQGLILIEKMRPDLVITDMKMPVMDGLSLLPVLAEKYPDIFLIVISGYQDFEYMRQALHANAVDYILKPFSGEEIISTVQKSIDKMGMKAQQRSERNMIAEHYENSQIAYDLGKLQNLIEGHGTGDLSLTSRKIRLMFYMRKFILITLYSEEALNEASAVDFLRENHYENSILYLSHSRSDNLGYLILTVPAGETVAEKNYSRHIINGMSSLFWQKGQKVLYGISGLHKKLSELTDAYKETVHALNQTAVGGKDNVFEYTGNNQPPRRVAWPETDRLIFCVESGRVEDAGVLSDQLFSFYLGISGLSLWDIKFNCYHIISQLRYMISYSISEPHIMRAEASTQNTMNLIFSVSELHEYCRNYFINTAQNLAGQEIYGDEDLVNNVKTYIEHYYSKNISVEIAASLFHVNRSYLSHIFKKRAGVSFVDYLNCVRIRHAKELLTSSHKKMYQIALLSGYNNVRYFFRAFKKVEGMTPEQYRKSQDQ